MATKSAGSAKMSQATLVGPALAAGLRPVDERQPYTRAESNVGPGESVLIRAICG
jgi:hypothetical protein